MPPGPPACYGTVLDFLKRESTKVYNKRIMISEEKFQKTLINY